MSVVLDKCEHNDIDNSSGSKTITIGVLGLQGDFDAHRKVLERLDNVSAPVVKMPEEIQKCDGLIIPGGESTTVGKLMARYDVDTAIKQRAAEGMAVFGTCTGMILLSKDIEGSKQHRLDLMNTTVRRNAFGRQIDSFEEDLYIPEIGNKPLRAVFIRAPYVLKVGEGVKILASLENGHIVMVRQNKILAAAFHPELTDDIRVHQYFADIAKGIK